MQLITTNKQTKNNPHNHNIKKRHWFLASSLIVVCSWITHTTTASISYELAVNNNSNQASPLDSNPLLAINSDASFYEPHSFSSPIGQSSNAPTRLNEYTQITHKVKKGESLGIIFNKLKFDGSLPYKISQNELGSELVSLSIGKELTFGVDDQEELKQVSYPLNALQELIVEIDDSIIKSSYIYDLPYQTKQHSVSGEITFSLYDAALQSGLSNSLIMEMVEIFGWDIDFVLDIRKGDTFHVIYEDYNLNNKKLANGNILAAEFVTQNQTHRAIRYTDKEGNSSYYSPEGSSMLGTFLRSPVEFSRISSRFGKRKHPILKKWRAHKGVDYAAARGTPIRATADGKITLAGTKGGYGKTVIIRHAGRFSTLYAHMKGYAKNIRSGKRVKQGDIIGYIGSTGMATGPHLHYEFRVDGTHKNPLTYKTPKASSIDPSELAHFRKISNEIIAKLEKLSATQLAEYGSESNKRL